MEIIKYYEATEKEHWKELINQGDWSAAQFLFSLLDKDELKKLCGNDAEVYMLTDKSNLVSFAVLAAQDEIDVPELSPWIGFVYTFPQYRGQHNAGKLINHICDVLKQQNIQNAYISTEEIGLYEKYGFEFMKVMTNREGKPTRVYIKAL